MAMPSEGSVRRWISAQRSWLLASFFATRRSACSAWPLGCLAHYHMCCRVPHVSPVQDYRSINKWTMKNHNISPLIPQVIDRLRGCTLFTKVNVCWGYNNIQIKEGDEWKATFLTPKGLFKPTVMFFSLTNSPATFQMMMNTIF